jgi:hypothetical protein
MLLVALLFEMGLDRFNVMYSDPIEYVRQEKTDFSKGAVTEVRQVMGFEGIHVPDAGAGDLLVIGTGFDDRLMKWAAEAKVSARKAALFGLPALQPDMYQQNVLRTARVADSFSGADLNPWFAPASDPFVTAQTLHDGVRVEQQRGFANLYLCPVGTKAQALGFALYYLHEWRGQNASMIFPFSEGYEEKTSRGLSRVWMYTVEKLPWF